MKKINDLKEKRNQYITRMEEITSEAELSDELRSEWESLNDKVTLLDKDIKMSERQENLNKMSIVPEEVEEVVEERMDVISGMQEFFRTGVAPKDFRGPQGGFLLPFEMRDNLTTTKLGATLINKTISDELSIAKTPAETLIAALGVTKYTGLNGQFVVPSMAQVNAGFVAETVAVADASAAPASLTLTPRRLGAYATVTKETLVSSNPSIWNGIIQDIRDAWYRAQVADLFDQIQTDCVDASTTVTSGDLAYIDLVKLQANVPYDLRNPAFVTTPAVASWLKTQATISSVAGPVWQGSLFNGSVDGIPAYATTLQNTGVLFYGDFSQAVIGEWGSGLELLLNPYEYDVEGMVKVTVSGMTDSGFKNYRFSSFIVLDASEYA